MARRPFDRQRATELVLSTDKPLHEIATEVGTTYGAMRMWYSKAFDADFRTARKRINYSRSKAKEKHPLWGKRGDEHWNFKGRSPDGKGYYTVLKPSWWTGPNRGKRLFEHHVVYAEGHGLTRIPEGMEIHHKDHNPGNNELSNLQLVTPEEHRLIHLENVSKGED